MGRLTHSSSYQMLTKERPFSHRMSNAAVIVDIVLKRLRPRKPTNFALADKVWPILTECWQQAPGDRLSMMVVCEELQSLVV